MNGQPIKKLIFDCSKCGEEIASVEYESITAYERDVNLFCTKCYAQAVGDRE